MESLYRLLTPSIGVSHDSQKPRIKEGEHDLNFTRSDIALFFGILMSVMAVGGTFAGRLPGRFGDVSSRTKNPKQYWSALAGYYLAAIGFIGYYLYQRYGF
jgi:hypothetical protein